ncbi:MAG TPA: CHASE3 domain-containing protein, partial [Candidatus Binataceae bacterium]|nr:CHASE3 domain-containing protein [Candidatus Binataceae bacterium]
MPNPEFRWKLTLGYLIPCVIAMAISAAILLWRVRTQLSITGWIQRRDQVILRAKDAELEMRDIQVAFRSYLLSPSKQYLADLGNAQIGLAVSLARMAALVANDPDQERRVVEISDLKENWTKVIDGLIGQRDRGQSGIETFSEIRPEGQAVFGSLENFIAAEHQLRALRNAQQIEEIRLLFVL